MPDDNQKVVKLRQPQPKAAAGVSVDEAITPKSFMNMTDLEQDMYIQQLRERRMRVVEVIRQAKLARAQITSITDRAKLERKIAIVEKQLEKVTKALDKLEEQVYGLRALKLQYTDTDIQGS